MAEAAKKTAAKKTTASQRSASEKQAERELEDGFRGIRVDPTPNESYSLETGQDAPTPETDAGAAEAAVLATVRMQGRFTKE